MSYKIAVASSDGLQIDETFGAAKKFLIYDVEKGNYRKSEERVLYEEKIDKNREILLDGLDSAGGCGAGNGCGNGNGCGGARGDCDGTGETSKKVELVADCRCIVCRKIGFYIQKQLERKAISAFDVSCSVEEALEKISYYFERIDNHESLRTQRSQQ